MIISVRAPPRAAHKAASDADSEPRVERAEGPRERAAQSGSATDD